MSNPAEDAQRGRDIRRDYRKAADKYDSEWVDPAVSGDAPSSLDNIQSSSPTFTERGLGRLFGRKK
jgi:hypothetical protein